MATAISIVESAMRDAGEVWFLPWEFYQKKSKATLKLVDTLVFIETPVPFPTQMWYLRARCNTIQTYQIGWFLWCHNLFRFLWWWAPCKAENLCRALGRNPAFCEAVLAKTLWQRLGSRLKQCRSSLQVFTFTCQIEFSESSELWIVKGLCAQNHYWWGTAVCA